MKIMNDLPSLLQSVASHQTIFVHGAAATPQFLMAGLIDQAPRLKNVELIHLHTEANGAWARPEYRDSFRVTNLFMGHNVRPYFDFDRIDYLPCFLSEIPMLFRNGFKKIDVALIQVSPPDKHGYVSLGVSVDVAKAAVESAKTVIAQINSYMPRVHGDGLIHINQISAAIHHDQEIFSPTVKALSAAEISIGKNVASLVDDGATLQLGIGNIPNAVCKELLGHRNLGLHSEMWSDGAFELIQAGVINNSQKNFHRGKSTSAFMIGSKGMYSFCDDNPAVLGLEANYVNSPINIMRNPKVTAINSAVEIDLTGQVCADSIGSKIISGVGGQMDFMRGAALSPGGKPILALTSTSKNLSRIVSTLKVGAGVVTTRSHVHFVVTEFGVVQLFGKSLNERAQALISIAHPDHQENLARQWHHIKNSVISNFP